MSSYRTKALPLQMLWLIKHRPHEVYHLGRGFLLFQWARLLRLLPTWNSRGISLGENVRLQRNSSLRVEAPHASVSIGEHSIIYEDTSIEVYGYGKVEIGPCSVLGGVRINSRRRVSIGARCLASWNVFIQDFDSHPPQRRRREEQVKQIVAQFRPRFTGTPPTFDENLAAWDFPGEDIVIGDDVWLGANVTILKGVHLGPGCVVAAGSVVTRGTYPPSSLIAGNPGKIVRELAEEGKA